MWAMCSALLGSWRGILMAEIRNGLFVWLGMIGFLLSPWSSCHESLISIAVFLLACVHVVSSCFFPVGVLWVGLCLLAYFCDWDWKERCLSFFCQRSRSG
eukprot:RCo023290